MSSPDLPRVVPEGNTGMARRTRPPGMDLSGPLRALRASTGWSLEQTAAAIRRDLKRQGLGRTGRGLVWRWETGRTKPSRAVGLVVKRWAARQVVVA